nr:nucleotide-binding alpha-beta plait domain-containing protein [Tanacetum cinerariifolium]
MKTVLMESFKMVYGGKVCWVRVIEIPGWVPDFEEDSDVETNDDSYEDEVQEINSGHHNNLEGNSDIEASEPQSEDQFGIYEALKKKVNVCNNGSISKESHKYPPGFTPKDVVDSLVNDQDDVLENSSIRNGKEDGGNSGGILCVWDPNMFKELNETVSDFFTIVRGHDMSCDIYRRHDAKGVATDVGNLRYSSVRRYSTIFL